MQKRIGRKAVIAVLVSFLALTACALPAISEAQQGKAFVQLLEEKGFKEVGEPNWESESKKTSRVIGGKKTTRTTTERVVEVTARVSGCTAEFEQVRDTVNPSQNYTLDEFRVNGRAIDVDEGTEVSNLLPDQVVKYVVERRKGAFEYCYTS